jgi:CheY-like chemotaxis protein
LGYTVLSALSGREALDIFQKNSDRIDLVIMDMIMPGMGGGETFDRLRAINPNIKVLLSSGYSVNGQASKILQRGCDGFIQKPFNLSQLAEKIGKIMVNRSKM